MATVMIELDEDLVALLRGSGQPRDQPLEQTTREMLVMELFRRGTISSGKACELLAMERLDFLRRANELGVPVYLTTEEEWEHEKATVDGWLKS